MRWRAALAAMACLTAAEDVLAQSSPSPRFQLDTRIGFLVTFADGHPDRPLAAVDLGVTLIAPRIGGRPGLTLTAGAGVGFSDFFADTQSESFRLMAGVEAPWALAKRGTIQRSVQLVPHIQVGALTSNGGDERDGLLLRAALGLRVPVGAGGMHFTFEPVAVVRLPAPEFVPIVGAPSTAFDSPDTRWALELGIVQLGWRF